MIHKQIEINPNPDTIIRVLMPYKGLENPIDVQEQELAIPNRTGVVAVEWGWNRNKLNISLRRKLYEKKSFIILLIVIIIIISILKIINKSGTDEIKSKLVENSNTTYLSINNLNIKENIKAEYLGSISGTAELINVNFPSEGESDYMSWRWNPNGNSEVWCNVGITSGTY